MSSDPPSAGVAQTPPPTPLTGIEQGCVIAFVGAELVQNLIPVSLLAWLIGLALLAYSAVWSRREKFQVWLWLSSGFPLLVVTSLLTTRWAEAGERPWYAFVVLAGILAFLIYQVIVAIRLLRRRA